MNTNNKKVSTFASSAIPLPDDDVDTDRIIPARFMRCVTFNDLGLYAFYDERFDASGNGKDHPFNDKRYSGARMLLVGSNFGCGSSREHAPQALLRFGIGALIGVSFADIFAGNCTVMGIPAVTITQQELETLIQVVTSDPAIVITIDLLQQSITCDAITFTATIPESYRQLLVQGIWDTTSLLLTHKDAIHACDKRLRAVYA